VGLEMDQESIGIALVYVGVCEGDVGRLDCSFVLLHSDLYILYSIFYMLYSILYVYIPFFSFFLGFRRPNLITGLSGWRTPD